RAKDRRAGERAGPAAGERRGARSALPRRAARAARRGRGRPGGGRSRSGTAARDRAEGLTRLGPMRRFWQRGKDEDAKSAGGAAVAAAEPQRLPEPDPPAAALFDAANPMMRGAAIYYFARALAARKLFTMRDLAMFAWGEAVFRLRGTENSEHIGSAKEAALS